MKVRYVIIAVISAVFLLSVIAAIGFTYYPRILGLGAGHGKANDSASAYDTRTLERLYSQMQAEVVFDSVASWAMECMGAPNYQKLPLQYQVWLSYLAPDGDDPPFPEGVHKLTNKQRSVVVLNRSLSFDREYYGLQQQEWYVFYEILQLSLIFVGMLTTITVSISSSEFGRGEGLRPRLFRFFGDNPANIGDRTSRGGGFLQPASPMEPSRDYSCKPRTTTKPNGNRCMEAQMHR